MKPFADVHTLPARAVDQGQTAVLASSASQSQLNHYPDPLDARSLVTATTSADVVGNTKPAPDIFAVALEKVAPLDAGDIVEVGDTPYEIEAAAKCGIAAIGLRSGGFADKALADAAPLADHAFSSRDLEWAHRKTMGRMPKPNPRLVIRTRDRAGRPAQGRIRQGRP